MASNKDTEIYINAEMAISNPLIPSDTDNCWICLMSYADDKDYFNSVQSWSAPCGCKGSSKWVHKDCLQRWVDEKQQGDLTASIKCAQCHTFYKFKFPQLDPIAQVIFKSEACIDLISPYFCLCAISTTGYLAMTGYGYLAMLQVVGFNETNMLLDQLDPGLVMILLPAIPLGLSMLKLIRIEDRLYRYTTSVMKILVSGILGERVFRKYWPSENRLSFTPTMNDLKLSTVILTGLMLPTIAYITGHIMFPHIKTQLKRSIFGGLFYSSLILVFKFYSKYQYCNRISKRVILNFPHNN